MPDQKYGRDYVGADCTLDGKPAMIVGRNLDYAVVAQYPQGLRVEYAWPTVAHVMTDKQGRFRS